MNYLMIGAGPAALAAAGTLRQADRTGRVTILSREEIRPYSRMALPYVLAARIEAEGAFSALPEGVELLTGEKAVRIDAERREVQTASGKVFPYDRLLIASRRGAGKTCTQRRNSPLRLYHPGSSRRDGDPGTVRGERRGMPSSPGRGRSVWRRVTPSTSSAGRSPSS